ncbi:MAG: hypothetical protein ACLFQX_04495 [Candidatus Kapaibacterium sp.]
MKTKRFFLAVLLPLIVVILAGCASTETTSFRDPEFIGKQYDKICVYADITDLKYRLLIENEMVKEFREAGVNAVRGYDLFPPTREWSDDDIHRALVDKSIEGYLLIAWTDRNVEQVYKPGDLVTETKKVKDKDKKGKEVTKEKSVTYQTPGHTENKYYSAFETKLIDVKTSKVAWIATSQSESGESFSGDFRPIIDSYSDDIVETLGKDGLIRKK